MAAEGLVTAGGTCIAAGRQNAARAAAGLAIALDRQNWLSFKHSRRCILEKT
jgi:hypothetical protein